MEIDIYLTGGDERGEVKCVDEHRLNVKMAYTIQIRKG